MRHRYLGNMDTTEFEKMLAEFNERMDQADSWELFSNALDDLGSNPNLIDVALHIWQQLGLECDQNLLKQLEEIRQWCEEHIMPYT